MRTHPQNMVLGFAVAEDPLHPQQPWILLIRKNRPEWQAGKLNGVGGKIERGDFSAAHAMAREFREETGLQTSVAQWHQIGRMHFAHNHTINFVFQTHMDAKVVNQAVNGTDEELCWIKYHYVEHLRPQLIGNLPWLLEMVRCSSADRGRGMFAVEYGGFHAERQR